jgi:3-oxoacyl-[acyl-carrier-protein] synthase II
VKALAITGLGAVSAVGIGGTAFFEAMTSGESPAPETVLEARAVDATAGGDRAVAVALRGPALAEIPNFDAAKYLGEKGLRTLDRLTKLLLVASRLALHDARLKRDGSWVAIDGDRVGIVVSNAYGSLEAITELDRVATLEAARYINPARFPLTVANSAAGYASIWEDLRAMNVSVSDGNCGALDAVACADVFLEQQRADAIVVGGAEAISEALIGAYERLGTLAEGAFIGEGAAMFVLESDSVARGRGATVRGTVSGYGTAFVPPDREAALVHPSAIALERAIRDALADANVTPECVDLAVSGVSGLRMFDDAELSAIERVLGPEACVVAPKQALGETHGAGGAMGVLAALAYLNAGASPHVLRGHFRGGGHTALVTSMGYYGNASALVLRSSALPGRAWAPTSC